MKYIKLYEEFINEEVSQQDLQDFVDKFDLTDKEDYDNDLKKQIKDIIKMFRKGKTADEINSKYTNLQSIITAANKTYNEEQIRLALPQGSLQDSNPEIPKIDLNWGEKD